MYLCLSLMVQSYNTILSNLKKEQYAPIYMLVGEQEFFIDRICAYMEQNVLNESERDFNQIVLYGRDVKMLDVIDHAKRYPVMAEHQIVIVKEAQDLDKSEWNKLEAYAENPVPSTILVFCYKHKSFDKRTKVAKALAKHGVFLDDKKMYDRDIQQWMQQYIQEIGYEMSDRAQEMFLAFVGTDLNKIAAELTKLTISYPKGTRIDETIVEKNIGLSRSFNVFELQAALANKNVLKANTIVKYYEANPKEGPLEMIVATLYTFFIRGIMAAQLTDKSSARAICNGLGLNYFAGQDCYALVRNYSLQKLFLILTFLCEYDVRKKGIGAPFDKESMLIQELVYKILH